MKIQISDTKQVGQLAKLVRKHQGLDQISAGLLSGNGATFTGEFENGKPTVEIGRVMNVLDALGITMTLDIPLQDNELTERQKKQLNHIFEDK